MATYDLLITVASWEDRFELGIKRILSLHSIQRLLMFYYEEYKPRTEQSRISVREMGWENWQEESLQFTDPLATWRRLEKNIASLAPGMRVLLDISTMPREAIWQVLNLLEHGNHSVSYIYSKPMNYSLDWLSRDPGRPRLVFNQSGIAKLGYSTVLVVATGYDSERTGQLISFFEPKILLLALQQGDQFENARHNIDRHNALDFPKDKIRTFYIDAYSQDHGLSILIPHIEQYVHANNVIMTSLGPKPSAVALYKVRKLFPEAALAYSPSNDFNVDYSHGIGDYLMGEV